MKKISIVKLSADERNFFYMLITIAFLSMIITWLFLRGEARLDEKDNAV